LESEIYAQDSSTCKLLSSEIAICGKPYKEKFGL
jgi:hypothetical protein